MLLHESELPCEKRLGARKPSIPQPQAPEQTVYEPTGLDPSTRRGEQSHIRLLERSCPQPSQLPAARANQSQGFN